MLYKVSYGSWVSINFEDNAAAIEAAVHMYNNVSIHAPNPKVILSCIITENKLSILLYSKAELRPGKEGNALWLLSHELVNKYGFSKYVSLGGKLLRSA